MKAIGGYFGLELSERGSYHPDAIELNTGRNALEYILRVRKYKKIFIPYFTCDVLLEPIQKLGIEYEHYHIDSVLEPLFDYSRVTEQSAFLYTNYFGLKDAFIESLASSAGNLIVDNAQSFFSRPIPGIDTLYSARKFFGVSDGAYLYCDTKLEGTLPIDVSHDRMSHLLMRAEEFVEEGYGSFGINDHRLDHQPIKGMSILTRKILASINYEQVAEQRKQNFDYLHERLGKTNQLKFERTNGQVPMTYPFWTNNSKLKERMRANRIYCPTYWPNVLEWCEEAHLEVQLAAQIVHLPIDQRYKSVEIAYVMKLL